MKRQASAQIAAALAAAMLGAGLGGVAVPAGAATAVPPAPPYDVLTVNTSIYTPQRPTGMALAQNQGYVEVGGSRFYDNGAWRDGIRFRLRPPTGEAAFVAGRTYATSRSGDETRAAFDAGSCNVSTGSLAVLDLAQDDGGTITRFAATYDNMCDGNWRQRGDIRWHSEVPYEAATVTDVAAGKVVADQRVTRTATYTNAGALPLTISQVALAGKGATDGDWTVQTDGCTGPLDPGASCPVESALAPVDGGAADATLVVTDSTREGSRVAQLTVDVDPVAAPTDVHVTPLLGRNEIGWAPGVGRAPSGYVVHRSATSIPTYPVPGGPASVPDGATQFRDGPYDLDARRYYRVVALPAKGTSTDQNDRDALSAQVVADPATSELLMVGTDAGHPEPVLLAGSPVTNTAVVDDADGPITSPLSMSGDGGTLLYTKGSADDLTVWRHGTGYYGRASCASCEADDLRGGDPAAAPQLGFAALVSPSGDLLLWRPGPQTVAVAGVTDAAQPAWLPDGSGVVIADRAGGLLRQVAITHLNDGLAPTGSVRAVPGTAGASRPAVSPRGGRVAYLVAAGDSTELRVATLDGTEPPVMLLSGDVRGVSWSPDGSRLVVARGVPGGSEVTSVDPVTGETATLFTSEYRITSAVLRVRDEAPPTITVVDPPAALSSGRVTVRFTVTDDTEPVGSLVIGCSLDGAPPVACARTGWTGTVGTGTHTLRIRARDSGYRESVRTLSWTADATLPSARITEPGGTDLLGATAGLAWSGSDRGSGVRTYDVRYRSAKATADRFSAWVYPAAWQGTATTRRSMPLTAGTEYCASVRARDRVGNVGPWSAERCFARPLDDRALATSGRWTRAGVEADLGGTITRTTAGGAELRYGGAHAKRVSLIVTTCPTCGRIEVWVGGSYVGTVSTYSAKTRHRVRIALPLLDHIAAGRLVLSTPRAGKSTQIDGVILRRT